MKRSAKIKSRLTKSEVKALTEVLTSAGLKKDHLPVSFLGGPFVISDPSKDDVPIVFASKAFVNMTGYGKEEILGQNCRFLQGSARDQPGVEQIRELIRQEQEGVVSLRNFTKTGEEFNNTFLLSPLKNEEGRTVLYFGGQCEDRDLEHALSNDSSEGVPSNLVYRTPGSEFVKPNTGQVSEWQNEWSKGRVLVKSRTDPIDAKVADYFAGRNRMFEYQVQFEILEPIPDGWELYIGAEIEGPLQLGFTSRFIVSTILKVLKLFSSSLHHSYGGEDSKENAHLVFPFSVLPDNLTKTPAGETAPELTLKELPEAEKLNITHLEPGSTYTLSFYSQYVNFEDWTIVRVPGMRNVELSTFWADSPLHVVAYALPKKESVHDVSQRRLLLDVELVHSSLASYPK